MAVASVLLLASTAHADVVWSAPCPFGAREQTSHSGPRCVPWTCTSDTDCDGGLACRPWRVCVQTHLVRAGGRGAFRDPPLPPTEEAQVVGSCPPDARCDGTETPRPPTAGEPQGEIRCDVARYCARRDLPPIPPGPAAQTAPAPSEPLVRPATPAQDGCGCRAPGRSTSVGAWWLALVGLLLRRRR